MGSFMMSLVVVLLFVLSPLVQADDTSELSDLLAGKNTIVSAFEQISLTADGERAQTQKGKMYIARPNRFRWQVNEPVPQLVVSDGEDVYVYDELLEQVTITPVDPEKLDTPVLLLSGNTSAIGESFAVEERQYGETREFVLTPRASDNVFETLVLRFVDGSLSDLEMADSFGQKSIIVFTDTRVNGAVADREFRFTIPENVDVFRSETL